MWTIFFLVVGILVFVWAREHEKKGYNKGYCPICGSPLRLFDMDSQGGRGYTCTSSDCHYVTWCSFNVDNYR